MQPTWVQTMVDFGNSISLGRRWPRPCLLESVGDLFFALSVSAGEDCSTSSDCNISKGLCCKLQRRARSQPKKVRSTTAYGGRRRDRRLYFPLFAPLPKRLKAPVMVLLSIPSISQRLPRKRLGLRPRSLYRARWQHAPLEMEKK